MLRRRPFHHRKGTRGIGLTAMLLALAVPTPLGSARASEGGGDAAPLAPEFAPMPEMVVPISDAGQLLGTLRFTLVLRAENAETAKMLIDQEPRLRAAALAAGIEFARLRASPDRPVDVATLGHDLNAAMRAAEPGIAEVLIVQVLAAA